MVKVDVTKFCLQILNRESTSDEINFTQIVLILKLATVDAMSYFRPISLCSILYKIILKVLANKL